MSDETPQEPTDQPSENPATTPEAVPPAPEMPTPPVAPTASLTPDAAEPAASAPPQAAGLDEPSMPFTATPPPVASKSKRGLALVIAALMVLAGGGAAFAFFQLRGSSDSLMAEVPAGADLVATVYLNPAAGQKVDLFRMTDKFPILGSESDLTSRLNTLLDQAGQSVGLNHNDFQWIGSQAAVVVDFPGAASPNVELLVNVDDVTAAKATLTKVRANPAAGTWTDTQYKGVTVSSSSSSGSGSYAFVGNTLVLGNTTTGVDSIIDTDQGGASLADSADFKATSAGLPDGRLAFVYVNVKTLLPLASSAIAASSGSAPAASSMAGLDAIRGIGMTISAEPNGLAMDINESLDPSKMTAAQKAIAGSAHDNPLTAYAPSNAFGLVQMENLDTTINAGLSQLEQTNPAIAPGLATAGITGPDGLLASLTGDLTLEIAPGTPPIPVSGALVLGIKDPTKFADAVTKLKDQMGTMNSCSVGSSISAGSASFSQGPTKCKTIPAPKWQTEDYKGTTINFITENGTPSIAYATVNGAGLIGIGPDSIKAAIDAKAGSNITTNPNFTTAQGAVPSQASFFYLDVAGVLKAAAANSADPTLGQAATVLQPVKAIAMGGDSSATQSHTKILILIP